MIRNKHILFVFRLILGGVFIWAGLVKIIDPLGFAQDISNYRAFPRIISFLSALILPWIEVICGIFLISGIFLRASSLLVSASLMVFLVLIVVTVFRGINIDCGCFGNLSHKVSYQLIFMDSILFFFALNIFFSKSNKPPNRR